MLRKNAAIEQRCSTRVVRAFTMGVYSNCALGIFLSLEGASTKGLGLRLFGRTPFTTAQIYGLQAVRHVPPRLFDRSSVFYEHFKRLHR